MWLTSFCWQEQVMNKGSSVLLLFLISGERQHLYQARMRNPSSFCVLTPLVAQARLFCWILGCLWNWLLE